MRYYLIDNPSAYDWRAVRLTCFSTIYFVETLLTSHGGEQNNWMQPFQCQLPKSSLAVGLPSTWQMFLAQIVVNYSSVVLRLYPQCQPHRSIARFWNKLTAPVTGNDAIWRQWRLLTKYQWVKFMISFVGYCVTEAIRELVFSRYLAPIILYGYVVAEFFCMRLFVAENQLLEGSKDEWGFGQLVPVLQIILSLLLVVKLLYSTIPMITPST